MELTSCWGRCPSPQKILQGVASLREGSSGDSRGTEKGPEPMWRSEKASWRKFHQELGRLEEGDH